MKHERHAIFTTARTMFEQQMVEMERQGTPPEDVDRLFREVAMAIAAIVDERERTRASEVKS